MESKKIDLLEIEQAVKKLGEKTPAITKGLEQRAIKEKCEKCDVHKVICEVFFDESKQAPTIPLTSVLEVAPCGELGRLGCIAFVPPFTPLFCNELETALSVIDGGLMSWAGDTSNAGVNYLIPPIENAVKNIERDFLGGEADKEENFILKAKIFCEFAKIPNSENIANLVESINKKLQMFTAATTPAATPPPAQAHFNSQLPKEKLTTIFERLKNGGYFDANADVKTWLYICGVADCINDFEPLNWIKDNGLLAHLIDSVFICDNNKWVLTAKCFRVKGNKPNTNTLKKLNSIGHGYNNKKHNNLEKLLRV